MMKLLAVLPCVVIAAGCVPAAFPGHQMAFGYPAAGAAYGPTVRLQEAAPPIGRWDNVMMLATGTSVQVLRMDGGVASGRVVAADSSMLRLRVASGEVELAAGEVMRVDRLEGAGSVVRDAAKGAAVGAGAVGVLGLVAGQVPPARLFAAGGITGAYSNAELGISARGASTIYLAAAVAPRVPPAAQWAPKGVSR